MLRLGDDYLKQFDLLVPSGFQGHHDLQEDAKTNFFWGRISLSNLSYHQFSRDREHFIQQLERNFIVFWIVVFVALPRILVQEKLMVHGYAEVTIVLLMPKQSYLSSRILPTISIDPCIHGKKYFSKRITRFLYSRMTSLKLRFGLFEFTVMTFRLRNAKFKSVQWLQTSQNSKNTNAS